MKINTKALELIEKGLSSKTVSNLTESQINVLHSKLVNEQVVQKQTTKYEIGPQGGSLPSAPKGYAVKTDPVTKKTIAVAAEGEIEEDETLNVTKDPDATDDGMGIFETEKTGKSNPWAICHAQVGPKKTRKFERCVQSVKKQLGEGKNVVSLFLENEIMKIVERNLPPRITKGELVKYLTEAETAPAPTRVKPTTKPGTRPSHPGKNPNPGVNPAPKAKRPSPEEAKDKIMDVIMQILEK